MSITIIAQPGAIVNVSVAECPENGTVPGIENRINKWTEHKVESQRVARKMWYINQGRAERMSNCADILQYNYCSDCGTFEIKKANLCRDRFCPTCNWRLSLQRYAQMQMVMEKFVERYPDTRFSFVTLTVKNCTGSNLSSTMAAMSKSWNDMLHMKEYRDGSVLGYARSVEVTFNKQTKEFHPHYHVIVAWEKEDRSAILTDNWIRYARLMGLEANTKAQCSSTINYGDEGAGMAAAICETFKYAVKSKQLDEMPLAEFRQLVAEIGGKRLVSFGGIFKKIAKEIGAEMETVKEEDIKVCRNCGSVSLDKIIYKWSFGTQKYTKIL